MFIAFPLALAATPETTATVLQASARIVRAVTARAEDWAAEPPKTRREFVETLPSGEKNLVRIRDYE